MLIFVNKMYFSKKKIKNTCSFYKKENEKSQFIIIILLSYICDNLIIEYLFYFIQIKNYH
jgi:hypothetical protein